MYLLVVLMLMMGCEKRIGRLVIQELGLTIEVVKAMLSLWDAELESESINIKKRDLVVMGGALVVLVVCALQGEQVLLLEASELAKYCLVGKDHEEHPHVVKPLMGHFKMGLVNKTCY